MPIKTLPPVAYLHQCFRYDPGTGVLTWKRRPKSHFLRYQQDDEKTPRSQWRSWNGRYAGKSAGNVKNADGHLHVVIGNTDYGAHRVIWKLMTGQEPPDTIDHRDRNPGNNRWTNLRAATQAEQCRNKGMYSNNKSGRRGVFIVRGQFRASITTNGKTKYLGRFASLDEASAAYEAAARELYGDFYHSG